MSKKKNETKAMICVLIGLGVLALSALVIGLVLASGH